MQHIDLICDLDKQCLALEAQKSAYGTVESEIIEAPSKLCICTHNPEIATLRQLYILILLLSLFVVIMSQCHQQSGTT